MDPGPNQDGVAGRAGARAGRARPALEDIELLLLTHQHHDHVGLGARVRERSGAQVAAIAPLAAFLADFDASMDADDAYAVAMMRRHGIEEDVARRLNELSRSWRRVGGGVAVDRVLADGETVGRVGAR